MKEYLVSMQANGQFKAYIVPVRVFRAIEVILNPSKEGLPEELKNPEDE